MPSSLRALLFSSAALGAAAAAAGGGTLPLRPPPRPPLHAPTPTPIALPLFTPSDAPPSFTTTASARLHNRPLYSSHNGGLVIAGDRPLFHVASDTLLFGGGLLGLLDTATNEGLWAHQVAAAATTSHYLPGTMQWELSDAVLGGGVNLTAALLPLASGFGAVLDVNATAARGGVQVVVAFGCGTVPGGGNKLGWQYDPLLNPGVMSWTFTPGDCESNAVKLGGGSGGGGFSLAFEGAGQALVQGTAAGAALTFEVGNASAWEDLAAFAASGNASAPAPAPPHPTAAAGALPPAALPLSRPPTLWLHAGSLAPATPNGARVARWPDLSPKAQDLLQPSPQLQPLFLASGMGPGAPGLAFDGINDLLANAVSGNSADSTMFAVFRDGGSSGGTPYACCSGVLSFNGSFNGIVVLAAPGGAADDDVLGGAVAPPGATTTRTVAKLDYPGAGLPSTGHADIFNRTVLAMALYRGAGPSSLAVDGCAQATVQQGGTAAASGVAVGARNAELGRYFKGVLAEVVVFDFALNASEQASMEAYFAAGWPAVTPPRSCAPPAPPLAFARAALPAAPALPLRLTLSIAAAPAGGALPPAAGEGPAATLAAAQQRAAGLAGAAVAHAPSALVGAALGALGAAVDGLWRADPGMFVHGAMAWDLPYVGWRSEYGATVLGWGALTAAEGRLLFSKQVRGSSNSACVTDAKMRHTQEATTSRFYGNGRIGEWQGMYDMQSQMFDQQLHYWRWRGDAAHEAALLEPLLAHAQWAQESFDGDGNGGYASYINTWCVPPPPLVLYQSWRTTRRLLPIVLLFPPPPFRTDISLPLPNRRPTDSQWYNGGETVEETCYMHRAHEALRDLYARAGNASAAAEQAATMARLRAALGTLWLAGEGHPAASREEGGHRRLRADAWLYSIFLPIEAGLLSPEEAAQALHYSEWALQRDAIGCNGTAGALPACGVRVWTSNWVPSMWSVRQLWPGDNYALAQAYFAAGLPDGGWEVLQGNLAVDMLQSGIPGQIGKSNGGTDFNDAVHPAARALVEGLLGVRPNYPQGEVVIAPQLPGGWEFLDLATAEFSLNYTTQASSGGLGTALAVTLAQPVPRLLLRLPLRAAGLADVAVTGLPAGAVWNYTVEAGWGESTVSVAIDASGGCSGARVAVLAAAPLLALTPSIALPPGVLAVPGARIALAPPPGRWIVNFSDPQGLLSAAALDGAGGLTGVVNASILAPSTHALIAYVSTAPTGSSGGLQQRVLYTLVLTPAAPAPPPLPAPAAAYAPLPLGAHFNANLTAIFQPNTYLSPRPQTCAVRIGDDGWSAWTFPYWSQWDAGGPTPTFSNLANLTVRPGVIATPQGAEFALDGSGGVVFTSLWDNFPAAVSLAVPPGLLPGASTAWALVAGSTNPMQTLLANGVLVWGLDDGSAVREELVPPRNYWALSGWAGVDYSYDTDAWCLPAAPPPTVQLGENNRAMVYGLNIPAGRTLVSVGLETLSQEVVIGLLAVSLGK
jgi:hypothetical protein